MREDNKFVKVFVAYDGEIFLHREECEEYERKMAPDRVRCYAEKRLKESVWEYMAHKRGVVPLDKPSGNYTLFAGREHARALSRLRETLKKPRECYRSRLLRLTEIGIAAHDVLQSKHKEQEAVKRLKIARMNIKKYRKILQEIKDGTYRESVADFAEMMGFVRV